VAVNKVIYDGNTLIDITDTTATASTVIEGQVFYTASGERAIGVATGELVMVGNLDELKDNYDENGFYLSYESATTGKQYFTNTVTVSKGVIVESASIEKAAVWYLEQVDGYTDRFYIYTKVGGVNQYIYNYTTGGANFINLSDTTKQSFIVSNPKDYKFYIKMSNANKWLQHSKSGGGIRLYTDNANPENCQISFTYKKNSIVPYGTLEITENGTYDISTYKTVIVNIQ